MATKYGYQVWLQSMATKYGYKVWLQSMATKYGYKVWLQSIIIHTVDSHVVVLAVAAFALLKESPESLCVWNWKEIQMRNYSRYITPAGTANAPTSSVFPSVHWMRESAILKEAKRSAWSTWNAYTEGTDAFCILFNASSCQEVKAAMSTIERFSILMHDITNCHVNGMKLEGNNSPQNGDRRRTTRALQASISRG